MYNGRVLVQATVTAVLGSRPVYPCCRQCYNKLHHDFHSNRGSSRICRIPTIAQLSGSPRPMFRKQYEHILKEPESHCWLCGACQIEQQPDNISWRYCLNLTIADSHSVCSVAVFGKTLEPFFGVTASKFNSITASLESDDDSEAIRRSLEETFVGNSFLFGFKSHASIARLKKSVSSPITLAQIVHGGKTSKIRSGNQDRNNLVAVLMMSPYLSPLPTVASNIHQLKTHLTYTDFIPSQNSYQGKQEESLTCHISLKSSLPEESSSSCTNTFSSSKYSSFGQSTLGFSCEESLSKSCNHISVPGVEKSSSDVINGNSVLCASQSAESIFGPLPRCSFGISERRENHRTLKMSSCYKSRTPSSDRCLNVLSNVSKHLTYSSNQNEIPLENSGPNNSHRQLTSSYIQNTVSLKYGVHNDRKQKFTVTHDQNEIPLQPSVHDDSRLVVTVAYNLNEMPAGDCQSQAGKEILRSNEMSFENSVNDSSILMAIIPSQSTECEHEMSRKQIERRSYISDFSPDGGPNQIERRSYISDFSPDGGPHHKASVEDPVAAMDDQFPLSGDSKVSDVFEQLFDDISWLGSQHSQSNPVSKIKGHREVPESENQDDFTKCSSKILDKVFKDDTADQHQNCELFQRQSFKVDKERHVADQKKVVRCLLDKFTESVIEDMPESEDLDEFLKKASIFSQTSERELSTSTGNDHHLENSHSYSRELIDSEFMEPLWEKDGKTKELWKSLQQNKQVIATLSNTVPTKLSDNCIKTLSKAERMCTSLNQNEFHVKPADLNFNSDFDVFVCPLKSNDIELSQKLNNLDNNLSLTNTSKINTRTQILELLKDDCQRQRVAILKELKNHSLEKTSKSLVGKFKKKKVVRSETSDYLLQTSRNYSKDSLSEFDDTCALKTYVKDSRNKKKPHSHTKSAARVDQHSHTKSVARVDIKMEKGSVNDTKSKRIGKTKSCSNCDSSGNGECLFKRKNPAIHQRKIKKKHDKNLSATACRTASPVCHSRSCVTQNTSDHVCHGWDDADNCVHLQVDSLGEQINSLDTNSQYKDFELQDNDGTDYKINGNHTDKMDSKNCGVDNQDSLVKSCLQQPNTESEPLFSNCDDVFQLCSQNGSKRTDTSIIDKPAQDDEECASHFAYRHSNASLFSSCNGSVDLFDMSDAPKSISRNLTSKFTPTKSARKETSQKSFRKSILSKISIKSSPVESCSNCLDDCDQLIVCSPNYNKDTSQLTDDDCDQLIVCSPNYNKDTSQLTDDDCDQLIVCSPNYNKDTSLLTDDDCVHSGSIKCSKCLPHISVSFDHSKVMSVSTVGESQTEDGGSPELNKELLNSKSRRVKFSKRLSHVSTIKLMDIRMRLTSSPVYSVHNSSLKSCLKKSEMTPAPNPEVPFSQDLFSPSPIFNTNTSEKLCKRVSKKFNKYHRQPLTSLTSQMNNTRNKNDFSCISPSGFGMDDHSVKHQSVASPLLFSQSTYVGVTPKRDAESFQNMSRENDASPTSVSDNDRFSFLFSPDLFSP